MKKNIFVLFSLVLTAAGAVYAQSGDPVTDLKGNCGNFQNVSTYGKDNREEYCASNLVLRDLADSVAGFFTNGSSVTLTNKPYVYGTSTLMQSQDRVAPDQRFATQPAAAFCTGFLVGEDLMVTAGHCVQDYDPADPAHKDHSAACQQNPIPNDQGTFCENIRVVFGFRKDLGGVIPRSAPARNVYKCAQVVAHSLGSGPDYTVIRLDRKVTDRLPLAINRGNKGLSAKTPLFVIGHPSGLPLKIAGDAAVISIDTDVYVNDSWMRRVKWVDKGYAFLTNLDTFHGNSGSPVINLNTLLVEGILVSGDNDYKPHPNYPGQTQVTTYPQEGGAADMGKGTGEVCTKISVPEGKIPATAREADMLDMNAKAKGKLYPAMLKYLIKRAAEAQPTGIIPIPNYIAPPKPEPTLQWI